MMQQVATQRSDIAALPVDIESSTASADASGQNQAFEEVFTQATQSPPVRDNKPREKNADDITVDRSVKRDTPVEKKVDEQSRRGEGNEAQSQSEQSANDVTTKKTQSSGNANNGENAADVDTELDDALLAQGEAAIEENTADIQPDIDIQPDWLAFVDAIRKLNSGDETASEQDIVIDASGEGDVIVDDSALTTDVVSPDTDLEALIASLKGTVQTDAENTESTDKNAELAALVEALNEAVKKLMASEEDGEQPGKADDVVTEDVMKMAASLLASLSKNGSKDLNRIAESLANGETSAEADIIVTDAELLVSLIKSELGDNTEQQPSDKEADKNTTDDGSAALPLVPANDLMKNLAVTEDTTKTLVAESLADKVVALLPDSSNETQKAEVKQGVMDAVKQYQTKLDAGVEPAQTLEAMIADVIDGADILPDDNIEQRIAGEMQQLSLLVNAATQVAGAGNPTIMAGAQTRADNALADIQQVKAERVLQQPADADKAVNIHQPEGQQQLAEKVRWMVNARNSMAEIRLDPPELGSMQVRVNVSGDSASVNFVVQSPQARDALAQAEPRLREMLAEQGISLGESFVNQQQQGEANKQGSEGSGNGGNGQFAGGGEEETQVVEQSLTRQAQGGIDDYA
ncbi:flagellar hook-length control protein FliK [Alteromonas confluentis]|uniref:Flagellar hook-length control protein-like C-terminal domain-containing protein n=1 Tax=Alteromonas confluentis TaxID=1656094 RepID=A0A1E7Z621_9ALTE|nr:flagellar hook-length control protein FliK [Alteromonas confluentis]OFC68927.1 hypothetical protein BFC18_19475 [Alteromonas confluentis]